MTLTDFTSRVTRQSSLVLAALAAVALPTAGSAVALGLLAGGALTLLNFRWLVRAARAAAPDADGRLPRAGWTLGAVGRFGVAAVALAAVLASGWVHPAALAAGLLVLPVALVVHGLREAR